MTWQAPAPAERVGGTVLTGPVPPAARREPDRRPHRIDMRPVRAWFTDDE